MGESKADALNLSGMLLLAAYLAISAWTGFVGYALQYSTALLGSLVVNLLVFALALLAKHGTALRLSWVWLGANFVSAQAVLLPGTNYLIVMGSAAIFLLTFDLSSFLELIFPMKARNRGIDPREYERAWSLLKKHTATTTMYAASAGVLALAGVTMFTPVVFTYNPVLLVGVLVSSILVLTALLSSELRTRQRTRDF